MTHPRSHVAEVTGFLAILAVGVSLVPAGAHFFEMFTKLGLPPTDYMIVQQIYAGWAFFGIAIFAAIAFILIHAIMVRTIPAAFRLSLAALVAMIATQAIFWSYTQPVNVASANWSRVPPNLETARQQWEYSHAVNAGLTLLAFGLIIAAVLAGCRVGQRGASETR